MGEQVAENMRFYGDMRFKQLTLFMAGMTLVGAGILQAEASPEANKIFVGNLSVSVILAMAGMLFTGVMWVMEVRSTLYGLELLRKHPDLWPSPKPNWLSWLNATNAVLVLHLAFYGFWLWCLVEWYPRFLAVILGFVAGLLLLYFSLSSYGWKALRGYREKMGPL